MCEIETAMVTEKEEIYYDLMTIFEIDKLNCHYCNECKKHNETYKTSSCTAWIPIHKKDISIEEYYCFYHSGQLFKHWEEEKSVDGSDCFDALSLNLKKKYSTMLFPLYKTKEQKEENKNVSKKNMSKRRRRNNPGKRCKEYPGYTVGTAARTIQATDESKVKKKGDEKMQPMERKLNQFEMGKVIK